MKATIFATATVLTALSSASRATDSQLLNLVMPDAKVISDVNVAQAKGTPFGQYVLSQISANDPGLQQMVTMTGFDPTRDVNEVLLATNGGPGSNTGLAAATGIFSVSSITTAATTHGAVTETYAGVTILEDPKQTHGIAFLSGTAVVAGDIANVKAAIDRNSKPSILPLSVTSQISQLSNANWDAWGLTTVPLTSLGVNTSKNPPAQFGNLQNSLGSVQSVAGGVKFGTTVVFNVQLQSDTAQDATALVGVIQFLANMAQLNAAKNPQAVAALQSLSAGATSSGVTVTVSLSLPSDQFQQLLQPQANMAQPHRSLKK